MGVFKYFLMCIYMCVLLGVFICAPKWVLFKYLLWVFYYGCLYILTLFFYKCVWLKSQTNKYIK